MTNLNQPIQLSHQRLESLFDRINQAVDQPEILSTILEEFSITLEKFDQQQQELATTNNASHIELQHYRQAMVKALAIHPRDETEQVVKTAGFIPQ
jgi:inhibitor of KinA sporulation pathway (predicted exonuclease)